MDGLNNLLCQLVNLFAKSSTISKPYSSQLSSPGGNTPNPISVPSVANPGPGNQTYIQVLNVNNKRKQLILMNVGNTVVAVKWGGIPNIGQGDFTYLLQAAGVPGDGTGGLLIDEIWNGAVFLQSSTGTGSVNVTELI
jgi:hypothetical protein